MSRRGRRPTQHASTSDGSLEYNTGVFVGVRAGRLPQPSVDPFASIKASPVDKSTGSKGKKRAIENRKELIDSDDEAGESSGKNSGQADENAGDQVGLAKKIKVNNTVASIINLDHPAGNTNRNVSETVHADVRFSEGVDGTCARSNSRRRSRSEGRLGVRGLRKEFRGATDGGHWHAVPMF